MKQENKESLVNDLTSRNWEFLSESNTVTEMYNSFSNRIELLFNSNCPVTTVRIKKLDHEKPYISHDIKLLIKEKHRLQRLFVKKPITYGREYRDIRNTVNKSIRKAKDSYYRCKIKNANEQNNTKETWNILNHLMGRGKTNSLPDEMEINGSMESNRSIIANNFNEHFSTLEDKLAANLPKNNEFKKYLQFPIRTEMNFNPCSESEIIEIVSSFHNSTAPGIDQIPVFLFKENIASLANVIASICNRSLTEGIFPDKLAMAIIVCLFKKGNPCLIENYRGISLLVFSKILEKIVFNRLVRYFNENNLFTPSQFGFRKGMSTEDAIQALVNSIYDAFDSQNSVVGVFIDLAKAFDSVDRDYLLDKLRFYGIKNVELQWFRSYLSNRNQCVKFKGELSDVMSTNFGIPQGGVLSALLYIIYVNDIEFCSRNIKYVMYADDTCVFYENKNLNENIELLNNELKNVCDWMDANRLTVNSEKSNYIIFSRAQKMLPPLEHEIKLKECVLTRVNCTKYLGILH